MDAEKPRAPTPEDVDSIRAIADPMLRNLRITQCYHELSLAFAEWLGDSANWCTFATWASRQAGRTIRGEDLLAAVESRLSFVSWFTAPIHAAWRWLLRKGLYNPQTRLGRFARAVHSPLDALERPSGAVARGNQKVFEEIGREFARFLAADSLDVFLDNLLPGEPPDGQRLLREAFYHYIEARTETDPKRRAEWILLANLKIGLHEQTRLQPDILEALDAPADEARASGERLLVLLFPGSIVWWNWVRRAAASVLDPVAKAIRRFGRKMVRLVVTDLLMTLTIPVDRVLRLGHNLEQPFPSSLEKIEGAVVLAFVGPLDLPDSGAEDWAAIEERMRYICRLFRAFQEERRLFDPPFEAMSASRIRMGFIPDGKL